MDIESYKVLSCVGKGGSGTIYKAQSLEDNKVVVLKEFDCENSDKEHLTRFRREADICTQLDHKNIIKVYRHFTWENKDYIAMEFLAGHNLAEKAKIGKESGGGMPTMQALGYIMQVAEALSYAHTKGIIHRDVKPENIMLVDGDIRAVLMDFGLAKSLSSATMTRAGNFVGTPQYMAPEQLMDVKNVGPWTDVYCLGVTLFSVISGIEPFYITKLKELFQAVVHTPLPGLPEDRSNVHIDHLLKKMTQKKTEDRFQYMDEVIEEIKFAKQASTARKKINQKIQTKQMKKKGWKKFFS